MSSAIHVAIAPGVAISLAVLGWNLLGDGLRDALDPRLTDRAASRQHDVQSSFEHPYTT